MAEAKERCYKIILMGDESTERAGLFKYMANLAPDKRKETRDSWTATFTVSDVTVKVRVSDTPSEVVSPKSYYFSADGAILVYDTTDLETLNNLQHWLKMLRWARGKMQPVCALWGNKGSGWNSVEEANVTGFQDRNEEKVRLLAKVDVSNDDGHIMEQFNELLKEIHFTHTKSYPSLRQNTGIDTGSVVHLDDYSNESETGKRGCLC